jgi:putative phosphoesterase
LTIKLAVISDVHADVHALRDALARVDEMGCDLVVCAGDLVDYGLFPEGTLALLAERRIPCIRGNHDRWATAADGYDTTGFDLTGKAMAFLEALPSGWDKTLDGVRVAVRHGTPKSDMTGIDPRRALGPDARRWLTEADDADVLLVGHTHLAFALRVAGGGLIANPGALLRDPASKSEAGAMLYDPDSGKFVPAPPLDGGTFGVLRLPERVFSAHRAADGREVDVLRIDAPETANARAGVQP